MKARLRKDAEEKTYRVYVTDTLRLRAEGKYISGRWLEIIDPPPPPPPPDTRPAQEIAAGMWKRIRGE